MNNTRIRHNPYLSHHFVTTVASRNYCSGATITNTEIVMLTVSLKEKNTYVKRHTAIHLAFPVWFSCERPACCSCCCKKEKKVLEPINIPRAPNNISRLWRWAGWPISVRGIRQKPALITLIARKLEFLAEGALQRLVLSTSLREAVRRLRLNRKTELENIQS